MNKFHSSVVFVMVTVTSPETTRKKQKMNKKMKRISGPKFRNQALLTRRMEKMESPRMEFKLMGMHINLINLLF